MLSHLEYLIRTLSPLLIFAIVDRQLQIVSSFNVAVKQAVIFKPDPNQTRSSRNGGLSYFGYSLMTHVTNTEQRILVGAPRDENVYIQDVVSPGALYECVPRVINDQQYCTQINVDSGVGNERASTNSLNRIDVVNYYHNKNNQWLAVSVDSQAKYGAPRAANDGGNLVVCAHNWKNQFYFDRAPDFSDYFLNGICYAMNNQLTRTTVLTPLLTTGSDFEDYALGAAGASVHYSRDAGSSVLLIGAPGLTSHEGGIIQYRQNDFSQDNVEVTRFGNGKYRHLGYSLSSGYYMPASSRQLLYASGEPNAMSYGEVLVYSTENAGTRDARYKIKSSISGREIGAYFGATLCSVDLTGDDIDELLVGSPQYTGYGDTNMISLYDTGIVEIYRSRQIGTQIDFLRLLTLTSGRPESGGRYGSAIVCDGDINMDRYKDVIVGAPYEAESGAVYIHYMRPSFPFSTTVRRTQRIVGSDIDVSLIRGFAQSISPSLDMDQNAYLDFAVGAYLSEDMVYLRSRPVIEVERRIRFTPSLVPIDTYCQLPSHLAAADEQLYLCTNASVCLRYMGNNSPNVLEARYRFAVEDPHGGESRRARLLRTGGVTVSNQYNDVVMNLTRTHYTCHSYTIYVSGVDFLTPVRLSLLHWLPYDTQEVTPGSVGCHDGICPVLDLLLETNNQTEPLISELDFARGCGNDSKCESNLGIRASYSSLVRDALLVASNNIFAMNVRVSNAGEEAYRTRLRVTYPGDIGFVEVRQQHGSGHAADARRRGSTVRCARLAVMSENVATSGVDTPAGSHDESEVETMSLQRKVQARDANDVELQDLLCDVGNPHVNQTDFILVWSAENILPSRQQLNVSLSVTTNSIETDTSDDHVTVGVDVRFSADLAITGGYSVPEEVFYRGRNESIRVGSDTHAVNVSTNMGRMRHEYQLTNVGPRDVHGVMLRVDVPTLLGDPDIGLAGADPHRLVYITEAVVDDTFSCDLDEFYNQYSLSLPSDAVASNLIDGNEKTETAEIWSGLSELTCETLTCQPLYCSIGKLSVGEGKLFSLELVMDTNILLQLEASNGAGNSSVYDSKVGNSSQSGMPARWSVQTKALIYTEQSNVVQPEGHESDEEMVFTILHSAPNQDLSARRDMEYSFPFWLIAVSVAGGALILIAQVLVFYKCGFFRRDKREALRRLKRQSQEMSNWKPMILSEQAEEGVRADDEFTTTRGDNLEFDTKTLDTMHSVDIDIE